MEHLNRAIELDPKYAEAYFDLAHLAVDNRDLARAYTLAEQAIALYPWGCPSNGMSRLADGLKKPATGCKPFRPIQVR